MNQPLSCCQEMSPQDSMPTSLIGVGSTMGALAEGVDSFGGNTFTGLTRLAGALVEGGSPVISWRAANVGGGGVLGAGASHRVAASAASAAKNNAAAIGAAIVRRVVRGAG